jgi:hypothetical protein
MDLRRRFMTGSKQLLSRYCCFAFIALLALAGCAQQGYPVTGADPKFPDYAYPQSETALARSFANGQLILTVAYNDDTGTDATIQYTPSDRLVLPGANAIGWSYSLDNGQTWTYGGKWTPPPGWSVLWGDPAMTTSERSYNIVFMSSLAIPDDKMPPGGIHGPVNAYLGGACIARSTDGGITFKALQALNNHEHFYDGGSLATSRQGEVYAAFVDVDTSQIDVWKSKTEDGPFELLPPPFGGMTIYTHPRLRVNLDDGSLYVAAQASNSLIYMNRWNGSSWATPIPFSLPAALYPSVNFPSGKFLRTGPQFSFDIGASSDDQGSDAIRMLYTAYDEQAKRLYVRGSFGPLSLAAFQDAPEWGTTPGNLNTPGDQFNPNVKAWIGFIGLPPVWKATYLNRDPKAGDKVTLQQGNLAYLPNGKRIFLPFDLIKDMPVCPDNRGYWGDYDDLQIVGFLNGSTAPTFIRTMSDSSLGCTEQWQYTSKAVHVRAAVFQ